MNNHMSQILNDNFNAFFLSDFHHQFLVFVSTAGVDYVFIFTTTAESYCSQFLKFMITFVLTMFYR